MIFSYFSICLVIFDWLLNKVNVLRSCTYFYISSTLELGTTQGLVTQEQFGSFTSSFKALLEGPDLLPSPTARPVLALTQMCSDSCLLLWLLGAGTVSCSLGALGTVPFNPSGVSFPGLRYFPHMHTLINSSRQNS